MPGLLTALAAWPDDEKKRAVIRAELEEHLAPDGLVFEVTPFAVPFLLDLAEQQKRPDLAFVAQLILEPIAYGDPYAGEIALGNTGLLRQVARELVPAVEFLYRQAASPEPRFRAQAVALLAPIDGRSARFSAEPDGDRELLGMLAGAEPDERVRASMIEAQRRLGVPGTHAPGYLWPAIL
ncbi:hypothetical protein M1L60_37315 [Actinoplanes sp. TRM 88003]|uniref:HEAT repeat domain-containing protein n=1 Tax=Paractinoplanes aksuensis TaxID=2939490 RepID=A0ABT1DZE1_9ACTN|nr:hypothetical protein [Actinoplanes aksuensis]MCO8276254.1 hypothetical protein [Actinoplanes aksuensis]